MDWRTITVSAEVEVYLKDVKEDVLSMVDSEELIDVLRKRDAFYDEKKSEKYHVLEKLYFNSDSLKRHLCDIVGVGYHEPKDSLLNKLKDML